MARPWGPPPVMYPPCPPSAGWYRPWMPPPMHFHPGWSWSTPGFGHRGYHVGDVRCGHVGHQQDRKASGLENRTVWNTKHDHLVSQEVAVIADHQHEQKAPAGTSVDPVGGSKGQTWPRSESSANSEMKPNVETGIEEATAEQNRVPGVKTKTRIDVGTSSRQPQNCTIRFPKPDHLVSVAQAQRNHRGLPHPRQLQHLDGVLQAPCPARGGGSSRFGCKR
jgi:hypothetical protein